MKIKASITGVILITAIMLSSCLSTDFETFSEEELANTLWTSPICGMPAEGCYGKDGYFLAEDGSLLYINIFSMTGDRWEIDGDQLVLYSHTEGYPEPSPVSYPLVRRDGVPAIRPVSGEEEQLPPAAEKLDPRVPEGRWLLRNMLNPENHEVNPETPVFLEIRTEEQGGYFLFGSGGVNTFRGNLQLEDFSWSTGPLMSTMMAGPGLEYEDLVMRNMDRVSRYILLEDFLFLYDHKELIMVLGKDHSPS
ncbi:MAG: META domain-containing protein [Spirochaetales bacterium]|nr:META domain-containing protein [Spirochaetales bacterium]